MADLFDNAPPAAPSGRAAPRPLADRIRPARLSDVIGQARILGRDGPLGAMLAAGSLSSLILWGPPGVGKTTIARLLARESDRHFVQISAIFSGVAELRKVFEAARIRHEQGQGTLLFVDEIHRFNKAQQDSFLPHMEDGTIVLVGATTENPSFELNAALLSRAQVLVLERLTLAELELLAQRAEKELARPLPLTAEARDRLLEMADGDGRAALNLIEQVMAWKVSAKLDPDQLAKRLMRRAAKYDKSGDEHYNLISAAHRFVQGGNQVVMLIPRFVVFRRPAHQALRHGLRVDGRIGFPRRHLLDQVQRRASIAIGHLQQSLSCLRGQRQLAAQFALGPLRQQFQILQTQPLQHDDLRARHQRGVQLE